MTPDTSQGSNDDWGYPQPDSGYVDPGNGSYSDPGSNADSDPGSGSYNSPPAFDPRYDGGGNTSSGGS